MTSLGAPESKTTIYDDVTITAKVRNCGPAPVERHDRSKRISVTTTTQEFGGSHRGARPANHDPPLRVRINLAADLRPIVDPSGPPTISCVQKLASLAIPLLVGVVRRDSLVANPRTQRRILAADGMSPMTPTGSHATKLRQRYDGWSTLSEFVPTLFDKTKEKNMDLTIPQEVTEYVRDHFRRCNQLLAIDLSTFPAIHEESLDMNFVSYFSRYQTPVRLPCNWIVRIDSHFIGGGRHFGTWEVADIGIMMMFRHKGKIIKSKLVFLQSKRLYPNPLKYTEESKHYRPFGLGRLLVPDEDHMRLIESKILEFKSTSRYRAFKKNDQQQTAMDHFERRWNTKMYYLFYNPVCIPLRVKMPMESTPTFESMSSAAE